MIGKLKYEQVEALITQLQQSLDTINNITSSINNNELQEYLNMILIDEKDPKKEERIEALNKLKLCESNASDNIINYLKKVIGI